MKCLKNIIEDHSGYMFGIYRPGSRVPCPFGWSTPRTPGSNTWSFGIRGWYGFYIGKL